MADSRRIIMRFADESESPTPSLSSLHSSSLSSASSTASTSSSLDNHHRGHQLLLLEAPSSKRGIILFLFWGCIYADESKIEHPALWLLDVTDAEFTIEPDSHRQVIQHATGNPIGHQFWLFSTAIFLHYSLECVILVSLSFSGVWIQVLSILFSEDNAILSDTNALTDGIESKSGNVIILLHVSHEVIKM